MRQEWPEQPDGAASFAHRPRSALRGTATSWPWPMPADRRRRARRSRWRRSRRRPVPTSRRQPVPSPLVSRPSCQLTRRSRRSGPAACIPVTADVVVQAASDWTSSDGSRDVGRALRVAGGGHGELQRDVPAGPAGEGRHAGVERLRPRCRCSVGAASVTVTLNVAEVLLPVGVGRRAGDRGRAEVERRAAGRRAADRRGGIDVVRCRGIGPGHDLARARGRRVDVAGHALELGGRSCRPASSGTTTSR